MIVGILKEIKARENRISMTPAGVEVLTQNGHTLLVEKDGGVGSGFENESYVDAGAKIVDTPQEIYAQSDMVMHVKELQPSEYDLIRKDQIVFTYLHLAAEEKLTHALIKSDSVCIAYETIQKADGSLPLLTPMSEVAGRMAIQQAAKYLEMHQGGFGVLLGGRSRGRTRQRGYYRRRCGGDQCGQNGLRSGGQGIPAGHESGALALSF